MGHWGAVLHITGPLSCAEEKVSTISSWSHLGGRAGEGLQGEQPINKKANPRSLVNSMFSSPGATAELLGRTQPDRAEPPAGRRSPLPTPPGPPVTTGLMRFGIHSLTAGLIKSAFNWIRSSRDGALPPVFNPRSSVK